MKLVSNTNLKIRSKKTFFKGNIYKKRNFFLREHTNEDIFFWDISIFCKNALYNKDKESEHFLHHKIFSFKRISVSNKCSFIQKNAFTPIYIDISSQGADKFKKLFFLKNKSYLHKHNQNMSCPFARKYLNQKSKSHIYLDNFTMNSRTEGLKKQICFKKKLSDRLFMNKECFYNGIVGSLSLDSIKI